MALPAQASLIRVESKGKATIKVAPLPKLRDGYLLIRTIAVGLNPTDWKQVELGTEPGAKLGCDYVGIVEEIGPNVPESFKKGDRVAGLAHGSNGSQLDDGAFGEYSVVKAGLSIRVPDNVSDEEAAGLGVGITTAGQGLYQSLKLPLPTYPVSDPEYILIYGGSTPTGILGIQFAKLSGFTVVTTSSPQNLDYIKSLGADAVFDYSDVDKCVLEIRNFTQGRLRRAFDCVSTPETARLCARVLRSDDTSHYSSLLGIQPQILTGINPQVHVAVTVAYTAFGEEFKKWGRLNEAKPEDYEFAKMFFELSRGLLEEGKLKPVRQSVNLGGKGLEGVLKGLQELKENRNGFCDTFEAMVRIVIVGGAGSVGHSIVKELVADGKHDVTVWTRKSPSESTIPAGAQAVQVTDYSNHVALVSMLQGVNAVLAFINPMTDPENQTQKALINACVAANVRRFAPSEWAGKTKSSIGMYAHKAEIIDYLQQINKEKEVLEYGLFQPGLIMDYLASPFPPSKNTNTFPLLFDLVGARAVIVEDGTGPMGLTAASDVGKVVARAIESDEPWSTDGGIIGEKTNMLKIVETAEVITGRKFELHHVKAADLRAGEWKAKWLPTFDDTLPPEKVKQMVVPFISGWALGIWEGLIDLEPDWNRRFPDIKFTSVEEMLRGAWERAQAAKKV
ncbi:hypothetical protein O1611_g5111 [Lasiodiplodia mahajangana]|uniref:Uncharacterized protein n=1 Tax=Lasiodiplodia mahajangana TaxID=1108764 RepID=A0ACC2JLY4_9PEZI|nr:hypothetical protein O1611_g5111 [Lasiodiplodia mahajangana]